MRANREASARFKKILRATGGEGLIREPFGVKPLFELTIDFGCGFFHGACVPKLVLRIYFSSHTPDDQV